MRRVLAVLLGAALAIPFDAAGALAQTVAEAARAVPLPAAGFAAAGSPAATAAGLLPPVSAPLGGGLQALPGAPAPPALSGPPAAAPALGQAAPLLAPAATAPLPAAAATARAGEPRSAGLPAAMVPAVAEHAPAPAAGQAAAAASARALLQAGGRDAAKATGPEGAESNGWGLSPSLLLDALFDGARVRAADPGPGAAAPAAGEARRHGGGVLGRPGPGVRREHLDALKRLADETGITWFVFGSRQSGKRHRTGTRFLETSDLDLGVVGDTDVFLRAGDAAWRSVPDAQHLPIFLRSTVEEALAEGFLVVAPSRTGPPSPARKGSEPDSARARLGRLAKAAAVVVLLDAATKLLAHLLGRPDIHLASGGARRGRPLVAGGPAQGLGHPDKGGAFEP